jgi:hypothetical protein
MDFSRASLLVLGLLALSVNALDPVLSSAPDGEGETKTVPLNNDHLPVEMDTNHEQTAMDLPLEQDNAERSKKLLGIRNVVGLKSKILSDAALDQPLEKKQGVVKNQWGRRFRRFGRRFVRRIRRFRPRRIIRRVRRFGRRIVLEEGL